MYEKYIPLFLVFLYKIATLVVGYLFAKLGYKALKKGFEGKFNFKAKFKDINADLISASPGLFFILMGAVIISVGLVKGIGYEEISIPNSEKVSIQKSSKNQEQNKLYLRREPPKEENNETKKMENAP